MFDVYCSAFKRHTIHFLGVQPIFQATWEQLSEYFIAFGPLEDVVVRRRMNNVFTEGVVTFERADDATKALNYRYHRLFDNGVTVLSAICDPVLCCSAEQQPMVNENTDAV